MKSRPTILYGTSVYDERVHRGILCFGRRHGWKVRLLLPHSWQHAEMLAADGIISLAEPDEEPGEMTEHLVSRRLPMVDLTLNRPEMRALRLLPDAREAGRMAASYFAGRHFRHWLHVCWGDTWHDDLRSDGFRQVAEEKGAAWELLKIRDCDTGRMEEIKRRLKRLPRPLAVFCSFDHFAEQVLEVCLDLGLAVPGEVAILGCYNHELHSVFAEVPLSTIDMGLEDRGYQAASLLHGLMAGEDMPEGPLYSPVKGVIERASTSAEASRDSVVQQALHFIGRGMDRPLRVEEVAAAVGVSRSVLQRRFERACGRGVGKEILRIKIDHAAKLLREGDDSAAVVAARVGFTDALHFYRAFKQQTGWTTRQYRQRHSAAE